MTKKKVLKSFVLLFVIVFVLSLFSFATKTSTTGIYSTSEFEIVSENHQYFIVLDERKLKISDVMIERVHYEADQKYEITYSYGLFNKSRGKVERIKKMGEVEG